MIFQENFISYYMDLAMFLFQKQKKNYKKIKKKQKNKKRD